MEERALDILLIEDEPATSDLIERILRREGYSVAVANDGVQAMEHLENHVFDLVVTDVRVPKMDGLRIFRRIRRESPSTKVILMSAYGDVNEAVAAMKEHAVDYLTKPFDLDRLLAPVKRIATEREISLALRTSSARLEMPASEKVLVGNSRAIVELKKRIETIARSDSPVLITGETGTGKELVARAVHQASQRRKKPFIAVNCASFPDTLLDAELFGHERGAFTGAHRRRKGRFKAADGGTMLLDEVAELSPSAQAKLLRVLQDGVFEPLGTTDTIKVDVRLVSATNIELGKRIALSQFREDLFYRLKVFSVDVPPLRERLSDLPLLVSHFLSQVAADREEPPRLSDVAWRALRAYPFPGNVRELEHIIEHGVVMAWGADIDLEHLPSEVAEGVSLTGHVEPLELARRRFEREHLLKALRAANWRKGEAARLLGISRKTLWVKLKKLGFENIPED